MKNKIFLVILFIFTFSILSIVFQNKITNPGLQNIRTWVNHDQDIDNAIKISQSNSAALQFDGVDDHINCGNSDDFAFTTQNFSVSFWIKPIEDSRNNRVIISKGSWEIDGWEITLNSNEQIVFFTSQSGVRQYLYSQTELSTSQWSHVIVVRDDSLTSGGIIYINGVDNTSVGAGGPLADPDYSNRDMLIGQSAGSFNNNPMYIDNIAIWERVITQNEIKYLLNGTIPSGSRLYYNFEQISGTTCYDQSGNNYDGTITGATVTSDVPIFFQTNNYALKFDGNDYIEVDNAPSLTFDDEFCLIAWINAINWDGHPRIYQKGENPTAFRLIGYQGLNFAFDGQDNQLNELTTSYPANYSWCHIVAQYTGSFTELYINGILKVSNSCISNPKSSTSSLYIGTKYSGALSLDWFHGKMDELRIYNRSLNSIEISSIFNSNSAPTDGLVLHFNFEQISDNTCFDQSGNNNHGTIYGATVTTDTPDIGNINSSNGIFDNDNDGLSNYDELNIYLTDPNDSDSDDDGLSDGSEVNTHGTDPNDSDSDDDGLSDGSEVNTHGTDPNDSDSDDDGLSDGKETELGTNPLDPDTDDDGFTDGEEVDLWTNPLNSNDNILIRGVLIFLILSSLITSLIVGYIVIRKRKVKKVNVITERGDTLKVQLNLEESIESYQKALLKAESSSKFVPKSTRNAIKAKLDETLVLLINQLLDEGKKSQNEGEYISSIESINFALKLTNQMQDESISEKYNSKLINNLDQICVEIIEVKIDKALKLREIKDYNESINRLTKILSEAKKTEKPKIEEQFNNKIINILDQIYVNFIKVKIEKALKLREMKNFDESINTFNIALPEVNKISDKELKDKFQLILRRHIYSTRMTITKSVIFDLGQNYARLEVSDIIEKCGEEEGLIISTIQEMIKNREISAEYFKGSKAIAFKQQIDIGEVDKLMKSFDEWEKEGKGKKT